MKREEIDRVEDLLSAAAFGEADTWVAGADLVALVSKWSQFKPMSRLLLFKLMDPPRGLEFYGKLTFNEKYYLLCGFPLASIAPVLETLTPAQKTLFHQMPREYYDRMFRQLVSERAELAMPVHDN